MNTASANARNTCANTQAICFSNIQTEPSLVDLRQKRIVQAD